MRYVTRSFSTTGIKGGGGRRAKSQGFCGSVQSSRRSSALLWSSSVLRGMSRLFQRRREDGLLVSDLYDGQTMIGVIKDETVEERVLRWPSKGAPPLLRLQRGSREHAGLLSKCCQPRMDRRAELDGVYLRPVPSCPDPCKNALGLVKRIRP